MKDLINKRHSVRKFEKGHVPPEVITEAVEYAEKAPSAGGLKAYENFWVSSKQIKEIAEAVRQKWIAEAQAVIVICSWPGLSEKRYSDRGRKLYCIQDATLFGAYLDLLLVEKGYGTCWVGAFKPERIKKILDIPNFLEPISLLVVGKKNEDK